MRIQLVVALSLSLSATVYSGRTTAANLDDFVDFSGSLPGRLYVPPEASDPGDPRPFILFLHGGLHGGTDNRRHINGEMDSLLDAAKARGAFLYAPQSPHFWNTGGWQSSAEIMTMIDQAIEQENIDPDRLYVTGLSFGGGGTWDMLNNVDDRFAAVMPVATDIIRPNLDAANFLDTPIWAFHARDDGIASVSGIRRIVNNILAELNEPELEFPSRRDDTLYEYESETIPLKYTEWPHGEGNRNHYIWRTVWKTEDVMDWMFSQRREVQLLAGDANADYQFDQLDLVQVQIAAKYLTGEAATWGEGDWNGAPGGSSTSPPAGDGLFDQFDIIAAQQAAAYLAGPYAAIHSGGQNGDGQTSVVYSPATGELAVDAPIGVELTSINIDSTEGIFTGDAARNLGGTFDNDSESNIFKATFGSSFGSVSFGEVARPGLSEEFVLHDLSVVGSLAGGGDLGSVDLIYVPEPSTLCLLLVAVGLLTALRRRTQSLTKSS